jgi:hypothetical protein
MSDDYARVLSVVGLAFNLVGVLILFRWGMPFRVARGGIGYIALERKDEAAAALDHIYLICGWAGLVLLILGTVLQILAALLPPTPLPTTRP